MSKPISTRGHSPKLAAKVPTKPFRPPQINGSLMDGRNGGPSGPKPKASQSPPNPMLTWKVKGVTIKGISVVIDGGVMGVTQ